MLHFRHNFRHNFEQIFGHKFGRSYRHILSPVLVFVLICSVLLTAVGCRRHQSSGDTAVSEHESSVAPISPGSADFSGSPDSAGSPDSSGSPDPSDPQGEDFVYVPSFAPLCDVGFLSDSDPVRDDTLYYSFFTFDEASGRSRHIPCALDLNTLANTPLPFAIPEDESVLQIALLEEDGLALLTSSRDSGSDTVSRFLYLIDADGQTLLRRDVTEALFVESPLDETGGSPQAMCLDGQGNIYVTVSSGLDFAIIVLDSEGESLFSLDGTDCHGLYRLWDGAVYTLRSSTSLCQIDPNTKDFGEALKNIPDSDPQHITVDGNHSLLIASGNQLYTYDAATQTCQPLLVWTDCSIDPEQISRIVRLQDGRILICTRSAADGGWYYEAAWLTRTPSSQIKPKTVLTYGTLALDRHIAAQITAFNKANDTYQVQIIEYGNDSTEEGLLLLNADMIAGHGPDILDLSCEGIDVDNYISKGILADLTPFLDSDPALQAEDFTENVLGFFARGNSLYGVPLLYRIQTLVGRAADVGDRMGWTMEDILELSASLPAGSSLIQNGDKESILRLMLTMGADDYIDWETGTCWFDGEDFINLLTFANTFPDREDRTWSYQTYTDIAQRKTLLLKLQLASVFDYQYVKALFHDEPISCVGYPTAEGIGTAIFPVQAVGMSAKSTCPEGAWAFIRTLLTEDYLSATLADSIEALPLREDSLEALFAVALDPESTSRKGVGEQDFMYDQQTSTPDEIAEIRQIIESARSSSGCDAAIYRIILEEAAPYFAGQKTAQEVADIIQSRIGIYVSENQ